MDKGTSLNTKCGVVILNYNSHDLTVALAKKVSAYECVDYICVVDNCSKDSFDGDFQEAKIHYIKSKKMMAIRRETTSACAILWTKRNVTVFLLRIPMSFLMNVLFGR